MNTPSHTSGFTLVEIIIVVTVISILTIAAISWLGPGISNSLVSARDSERKNDTASVALLLEQYYRKSGGATGPSYPRASTVNTDIQNLSQDNEIRRAPGQTGYNLSIAANSAPITTVAKNQYIYQPFTATDTLCNVAPCVRYTLYYLEESTDTVKRLESSHQQ